MSDPAPVTTPPDYTLVLNANDLSLVVNALLELPGKVSFPTWLKIKAQLEEQGAIKEPLTAG